VPVSLPACLPACFLSRRHANTARHRPSSLSTTTTTTTVVVTLASAIPQSDNDDQLHRLPSHASSLSVRKSSDIHAAQHSTWLMVHAIDGRPTGGTVVADAGHATAPYSQSPPNGEINNNGRRSSDLQRLSSEQQALSAATQLPGGWPQTPGANGTHNSTVREGLGGKDGSILTIPNGSHSSDRTPSAKAASLSARSKKSSGTMNGSENGTSNEHRSSEANRDANSRSAVSPDGYFGSYPANTKPSTPRSPMSRPVAFPTVDTTPNQSARTSAYGTVPTTPVAALSPVKESSPAPSGPVAEDMLKPPPQKPHHHRASSPPAFTPNGSSSPSILPMSRPDRLVHRHTLEVPKVITRTSKDGQDPTSDSAVHASGRFSPNTPTKRRGSLQLVRKQTKSVASDMPLDEFAQDEDAARWAEIIKAKRAKKQREDIDDERVVVGTKVDEHHVNYVTAYNMLTGIRFCVSRCNAKLDRALEPSDFAAKHKFSFDIAGNELTPSAKYDFKFKDYAPWVFRHMRAAFQIDPADYLMSLTAKYILSELGSPGKSGSFFYFSRDYKYIIKTIHHGEHKFLRKILVDYYNHVQDNPNTLLSQFYGLHRVKIPYGRKIHFVVMNNLFPPHRDIHRTFDLKGSTIGRDFKEEDLEKNPRATLKDLNWLRRNLHLEFGPTKKAAFVEQMQKDVALLQRLKIMDYSLLVGFHDLERGNEENLRDKTLQVFQPGGASKQDDSAGAGTVMAPGPGSLARTPSKMENAKRARELRDLVQKQRPIPMDQAIDKMPEAAGRDGFFFYADDGGFRATHEDDRPGEEIYYLGIIDCLTRVSNDVFLYHDGDPLEICSNANDSLTVHAPQTCRTLLQRSWWPRITNFPHSSRTLRRSIHSLHLGHHHVP
jgi:1-phosphatidylinositol-4-phosphate 5-kinase